ncbi:MAG: methyltransferase domain-containing protein [Firmicutes bacterium]|nr:methyltransferase domain-containing protein [Bacillota bacterium]
MSEKHRRYFNERAAGWDRLISDKTLQRLGGIIEELDIQPGSNILDVGTGTGVLIPFLQRVLGGTGSIVALDLAEEMLQRAREKHGEKQIRYVTGDIAAAPFRENFFDEVICNSCFPHFQNKGAAVQEMFRILKPGGRAVVCHTMSREQLDSMHKALDSVVYNDRLPANDVMCSLFQQAGFDDLAISDRPTGYLLTARKNKR